MKETKRKGKNIEEETKDSVADTDKKTSKKKKTKIKNNKTKEKKPRGSNKRKRARKKQMTWIAFAHALEFEKYSK